MNFLDKMERKIGKHPITGLMKYVIACYIIGFVIRYLFPTLIPYITLEPYAILHYGQIWRLISWVLIPPGTSLIWAVIMIIFYYHLGTALEQTWGAFRFNVFIFSGVIFTIISAFVLYFILGSPVVLTTGGYFSTYYLNLSIFLAFALYYPEQQVLLYFLIPVKMKWLAYAYIVLAIAGAVINRWTGTAAVAASLVSLLIFLRLNKGFAGKTLKDLRRKREFQKKQIKP